MAPSKKVAKATKTVKKTKKEDNSIKKSASAIFKDKPSKLNFLASPGRAMKAQDMMSPVAKKLKGGLTLKNQNG